MASVLFFVLYLLGFFGMHPHIQCTLSLILSAESSESLYHRLPLGMSKKCMCGVDDHLAWKRPISSETCRRLCTTGGYTCKIEKNIFLFIIVLYLYMYIFIEIVEILKSSYSYN